MKKRRINIALSAYILCFVIVSIFLYTEYRLYADKHKQQNLQRLQSHFHDVKTAARGKAQTLGQSISVTIEEGLDTPALDMLYRRVNQDGIDNIRIVDADGTLIYDAKYPETHMVDKPVKNDSPAAAALQSAEAQFGFETFTQFYGFVYARAVEVDGRRYSVAVSLDMDYILRLLNSKTGQKHLFMIKRDILDSALETKQLQSRFQSSCLGEDFLITTLQSGQKASRIGKFLQSQVSPLIDKKEPFAVYARGPEDIRWVNFSPLHTFQGSFAGYLVEVKSDDSLWKLTQGSLLKFGLAAVLFGVLYFIYVRQKNATKELSQLKYFIDESTVVSRFDLKGELVHVNKAFEQLAGYTSQELAGRDYGAFIPGSDRQIFDSLLSHVMAAHKWHGKLAHINKEGGEYILKGTVFAVFDKYDSIKEFIFIGHDVTSIENARKQKDKLLMHQSKLASIGEMVDLVAHQWKQPLHILRMKIDMLYHDFQDGELDEELMHEFHAQTFAQFDHMGQTLDTFRNFLRPGGREGSINLKDSYEDVMLLIGDDLQYAGIQVCLDADSKAAIEGNENEFKHLLLSLLGNAKDAFEGKQIEHKKITVTITQNSKEVLLQVGDNAGGIDEAILPDIFRPHTTSKSSGTGMGLYMSKQIANKLGGDLLVRNEALGALFTFVLKH